MREACVCIVSATSSSLKHPPMSLPILEQQEHFTMCHRARVNYVILEKLRVDEQLQGCDGAYINDRVCRSIG